MLASSNCSVTWRHVSGLVTDKRTGRRAYQYGEVLITNFLTLCIFDTGAPSLLKGSKKFVCVSVRDILRGGFTSSLSWTAVTADTVCCSLSKCEAA